MNKKLKLIIVTMSFINCLTEGNYVTRENLNQIVEKKSTRSEVKNLIGDPAYNELKGDLTLYTYNGCRIYGIPNFPILGWFLGSVECSNIDIVIDKDDKVKDKKINYKKTGLW